MLRVFGAILLAGVCAGASSVNADDRSFVPVAAVSGLSVKWTNVQRRMADDEARLSDCRAEPWMCGRDELRLQAIVTSGAARQGRARIGEINRAVNLAIRPVSDERRFAVADHWAGPLETIGAGAGDCEDYAILKLLALREAGIARDHLRLLIVKDRAAQNAHAVAAVRLDGRWLILDNRGFTLVDLEFTRYHVLAQLHPDTGGARYASTAANASRDTM